MRFKDREDAGLQLASKLSWLKREKDVVVIAIPRGGIIVADAIARSLCASLDIVVPRKLGAPHNPELAIGGVMHDGSSYLNDYVIDALHIDQRNIKAEIEAEVKEIKRRVALFRKNTDYDLKNKTVVMVDDGIATGATMMVSLVWVKKQKPKMVVLAVPVAPAGILGKLNEMVDRLVVLGTPADFSAVGEFYDDFTQLSDEDVTSVLNKYRKSSADPR